MSGNHAAAPAAQGGVSEQRRREVIDALRRGTVPGHGLDALAVGLGRFEDAADEALQRAAVGGAVFKAVRGEYGAGKTFFASNGDPGLGERDAAAPPGPSTGAWLST